MNTEANPFEAAFVFSCIEHAHGAAWIALVLLGLACVTVFSRLPRAASRVLVAGAALMSCLATVATFGQTLAAFGRLSQVPFYVQVTEGLGRAASAALFFLVGRVLLEICVGIRAAVVRRRAAGR